jgi:hypothetical protein
MATTKGPCPVLAAVLSKSLVSATTCSRSAGWHSEPALNATDVGGSAVLLRAHGLGGEAELTAAFNAAHDREDGDIIIGCDDAADAPEAMAAAAVPHRA